MVRHRARGFLALDLGLLRDRRARPAAGCSPERVCPGASGSRAPRSTTRSTRSGCRRAGDGSPRSWRARRPARRTSSGPARNSPTGSRARRRGCAASASRRATGSSPGCRTCRRPSSPCSRPPASARSFPPARRSSVRAPSLDRVRQIEPKVLIAVDGYRYGARAVDRPARSQSCARSCRRSRRPWSSRTSTTPSIRAPPGAISGTSCVSTPATARFEPVPFDHPLYILYSSGTTGLPKAIVHGHGGILLEHWKVLALHHDLGPADRFFWFTTTGWMMWNYLVSGLLVGSTVVLFDGDPGYPDLAALWRLAAELEVTYFGTSAPFLHACRRAALEPGRSFDLSRAARRGLDRLAAPPGGIRVGVRERRRATCPRLDVRRHRRLHRLRGSVRRSSRSTRARSPAGLWGRRSRPTTPRVARSSESWGSSS